MAESSVVLSHGAPFLISGYMRYPGAGRADGLQLCVMCLYCCDCIHDQLHPITFFALCEPFEVLVQNIS